MPSEAVHSAQAKGSGLKASSSIGPPLTSSLTTEASPTLERKGMLLWPRPCKMTSNGGGTGRVRGRREGIELRLPATHAAEGAKCTMLLLGNKGLRPCCPELAVSLGFTLSLGFKTDPLGAEFRMAGSWASDNKKETQTSLLWTRGGHCGP